MQLLTACWQLRLRCCSFWLQPASWHVTIQVVKLLNVRAAAAPLPAVLRVLTLAWAVLCIHAACAHVANIAAKLVELVYQWQFTSYWLVNSVMYCVCIAAIQRGVVILRGQVCCCRTTIEVYCVLLHLCCMQRKEWNGMNGGCERCLQV
jgi:hypothetical protein